MPATAPLIPLFGPPDISSNRATTLPHLLYAEVDYDGLGDDMQADSASYSADLALPTPSGSTAQIPDAPAETLDGPVPAVHSAASRPAQWVALPPTTRGDMIMKASLTVQKVHALDEEARQLQ